MQIKIKFNKYKELYENKSLLWVGVAFVFFAILFKSIYIFEPWFDRIMSPTTYLSWHTIFEFISVLISFCIFILPYYSYSQNHRLRALIAAHVFFIMGCIDMFHTLSYKGMSDFLIKNDTANRATTFWIIARLVGAIGITVLGFIKVNKKSRINKRIVLLGAVFFSVATLYIVTYFPDFLPAMYIEGIGVTPVKKNLEYLVILLFIFSGVRFIQQYINNKDKTELIFAVAIIASIFSEVAFVNYFSVYDVYNCLGHVFKFISYFLVFRVTFVNSIEKPYRALYKAKDIIKADARNLNKLVEERTRDLAKTNQKLLEDLDYARDIQKAMLPGKLPNNEHVSFLAKYYPAERVSGDFYNIFKLDEKNIGMYIGDVSGHGVPAAMLTVFLNQSIKTIKELDGSRFQIISPAQVLENLYKLYNKVQFKDDVYILALYAIYNTETKELVYSSAGMNAQPFVVRRYAQIQEIEIRGLPICSLAEICSADYVDKKIQLEDGDKVFFYTDGLVELNNRQTGKSFNVNDLKRLLGEYYGKSTSELYYEIDRNIKEITGSGSLRDDVTFFMLQVNET